MKIIDCIQGSPEWFDIRRGKITASSVHGILPGRNGYKAARKKYMAQLIREILTGETEESYVSKAMEHGKEMECIARSAYEARRGELVEEVGFIIHEKYDFLGVSPDGILFGLGIEIKCFNTENHIETILKNMNTLTSNIRAEYYTQIHVGMMCTGFKEWDFVSFDNRLPGGLQLLIERIDRDDKYCEMLEKEIIKFHTEMEEKISKLKVYQKRWEAK